MIEVGVVTEARVDPEVVAGVITVGRGGEDRAERDARRTELEGVIEPRGDAAQPVLVGRRRRVGGIRADEAQRIDLPPDGVLDPVGFGHDGRNFAS